MSENAGNTELGEARGTGRLEVAAWGHERSVGSVDRSVTVDRLVVGQSVFVARSVSHNVSTVGRPVSD
eukprot:5751399-Prymnesium_polylepis.1